MYVYVYNYLQRIPMGFSILALIAFFFIAVWLIYSSHSESIHALPALLTVCGISGISYAIFQLIEEFFFKKNSYCNYPLSKIEIVLGIIVACYTVITCHGHLFSAISLILASYLLGYLVFVGVILAIAILVYCAVGCLLFWLIIILVVYLMNT